MFTTYYSLKTVTRFPNTDLRITNTYIGELTDEQAASYSLLPTQQLIKRNATYISNDYTETQGYDETLGIQTSHH